LIFDGKFYFLSFKCVQNIVKIQLASPPKKMISKRQRFVRGFRAANSWATFEKSEIFCCLTRSENFTKKWFKMSSSDSKAKRCQYKHEDMAAAIKEVQDNDVKPTVAAKTYGVPVQTLRDRLKGIHNGTYGGTTKLSSDQELELVKWIEDCARLGQPLCKEQILDAASQIWRLSSDVGKNSQGGNLSSNDELSTWCLMIIWWKVLLDWSKNIIS
jgi:hypothetical protein